MIQLTYMACMLAKERYQEWLEEREEQRREEEEKNKEKKGKDNDN